MRRLALLLPFALAACSDPPPPAVTETPAAQPAPVTAAPPPAAPAVEPMTPAAAMPASSTGEFTGFRLTRFGMDDAAFRAAFKDTLDGTAGQESCYFLWPAPSAAPDEFSFMFEDGKFVRYGTRKDVVVAPGGGKVGMTRAQIDALYAGRIEEQPHKYTDGKYLRVKSDAGDNGVLVFETDAAGNVTEWRVGVEPQVDYVEGCS